LASLQESHLLTALSCELSVDSRDINFS